MGVVEGRVHAVAGGAPLVLQGELAVIRALRSDLLQDVGDEALGEGGQGGGVLQAGLGVEDPQLYGPYLGVGPHVPPAVGIVLHRARLDHEVHVALEGLVVGEGGGRPARGKVSKIFTRLDSKPVSKPCQKGEFAGEREEQRHLLREAVVGDDRLLGAWDGHVDVLAEDHLALGDPAQRPYDVLVALLVRDLLVFIAAEGVGAGRGQRGVAGGRPRADAPAQLAKVLLGLGGRGAGGVLISITDWKSS